MYWIYLVIFILAVLVPDIVPSGYSVYSIPDEKLEEILVLLLGIIGFLIFRWKEKQSNKHLSEKIKIQKEAHQISKSLTDTYSYIGETNRKLDVLKSTSLAMLNAAESNQKSEKRFFDIVMEAIYIIGKSKKFAVRFINTETKKTEREIKSRRRAFLKMDNEEMVRHTLDEGKSFVEDAYHFFITSPKQIRGTIAAIIISKNNQQQKLDDPDILKALAAQALFIHDCSKNNAPKGDLIK